MLTAEQLETRRGGLTATDMTKLTGLSKYGSAIDVLLDKQGVAAPFIDTDRVKWGNLLEDPIRQDYAERHQVAVHVPGTLTHPEVEWAMATPNGIVTTIEPVQAIRGWECKTHTSWLSHLYGEPGSDEVPAWELVQCAWNLYVARAEYGNHLTRWDLTAFIDGIPTDYVIERDAELEEMLVETGRTFWQEHVLGGKPLEPDGSEGFSKELARRFKRHGDELREADKAALESIEALRSIRGEIRDMEKDEERLVQHLKLFIGDGLGITFPGDADKADKITWKQAKGSRRTDWQACAQEWRNALELVADPEIVKGLDATVERFTTTGSGSRRFVVPRHWNK